MALRFSEKRNPPRRASAKGRCFHRCQVIALQCKQRLLRPPPPQQSNLALAVDGRLGRWVVAFVTCQRTQENDANLRRQNTTYGSRQHGF